jgi:uncharacterized protein YvpB|tara:strand:+ start:3101 stop:3313 length:213 start_codon:yes stop_codon:yes gene_type:complete
MSLDLLKKKFGHSVSATKKEVDKEKLNEIFNSNSMENLKSFKKEIGNRKKINEKQNILILLKNKLEVKWI